MDRQAKPRVSSRALTEPKGLNTSAKTELDRWIKQEEVLALLKTARAGTELWADAGYSAIFLMANLGFRVSECVDSRVQDYARLLSHNAIQVRSRKKGGRFVIGRRQILDMTSKTLAEFKRKASSIPEPKPKLQTIFVGDGEKIAIQRIVDGRAALHYEDGRLFNVCKRYLQYFFNYYVKRAGLRVELSCHSLRRFCATRIEDLASSVDPIRGPRMATFRLRHSEGMTREHYVEFSPDKQIHLLSRVRALE